MFDSSLRHQQSQKSPRSSLIAGFFAKTRNGMNPRIMWPDIASALHFRVYQMASYLLFNVMDDPAWLAMIFC